MTWSTVEAVRARLRKDWERGRWLTAMARGDARFPLRVALKSPSATDLRDRFAAVRDWANAWRRNTSAVNGLRLETRPIGQRLVGENAVPVALWIDSSEVGFRWIGKQSESARFREVLRLTQQACPGLLDWVAKHPMRVLKLADEWTRLLDVVVWRVWRCANRDPGVYLRQIDLPGIDSKFIESNRGVLADLLDQVLPPEQLTVSRKGPGWFERRYGFLQKPARVRIRYLDADAAPSDLYVDVTISADAFARLDPPIETVVITENEINFLSFPPLPRGLTVFGAGYGFDALADADWLIDKTLYYWGDIDTHGFAILNQLRSHLPRAKSLLMDRETLLANRVHWGTEPNPIRYELPLLSTDEQALYQDLCRNTHGEAVRLEQEKIPFSAIHAAISRW